MRPPWHAVGRRRAAADAGHRFSADSQRPASHDGRHDLSLLPLPPCPLGRPRRRRGRVLVGVGPLVAGGHRRAPTARCPRVPRPSCSSTSATRRCTACPAPSSRPPTSGCRRCPSIGGQAAATPRASPRWSPAPTRCGSGTPAPTRQRLALLGQLGESDLVRNGTDVWAWSSHDNTATHWTVPAGHRARPMTPGVAGRHGDDPAAGGRGGAEGDRPDHPGDHRPDRRRSPAARRTSSAWCRETRARWSARCGSRSTAPPTSRPASRSSRAARPTPAFQVGLHVVLDRDARRLRRSGSPRRRARRSSRATRPDAAAPATQPRRRADDRAAPDVVGKGWTSVLVATLPADQQPPAGPSQLPGACSTALPDRLRRLGLGPPAAQRRCSPRC